MSDPWFPDIPHTGADAQGDPEPDPPGYLGGVPLAPWWRRFTAGLIDYVAFPWLLINLVDLFSPRNLPSDTAVLMYGVLLLLKVLNEGADGQGLGKSYLDIRVVYPVLDREKGPMLKNAGVARCLARLVLHPIDWFSCVGFFRPLWNPRRQTFADSLTKTIVIADTELELDYLATGPALL
jgi:uncharacterized RDD family membrane protein YckC